MKSSRFFSLVAAATLIVSSLCSCDKTPDLNYGSSYEDDVIAIQPYIYTTEYFNFKKLGYHLTNKSADKTVKYFEINGTVCDHWGKELYIDGEYVSAHIIAVGPIEHGETLYYEQDKFIKTSAAEQVLMKVIWVEYTDGSKYVLK